MPRAKESHPELPWATKRGQELKALRMIDLHDPQSKLLLITCDLVVSQETGFYDLELDELRRYANMSRTTFYDRLKKLKRMGLISYSPLRDSEKQRVWIHRGAIAQMAVTRPAIAVRQPNPVRQRDSSVPIRDSPVRQWDDPVPYTDGSVRRWDYTTTEPTEPTEPTAPTENLREGAEGEWIQVRDELIKLQVVRWDIAIASLQQHVDSAHAIALCRHFCQHGEARGWTPFALYSRCRRARQSINPIDNWPPAKPSIAPDPTQSRRDLEREFGATLDALTLQQLVDMIHQSDATTQGLFGMVKPAAARQVPSLREHLLRILSRRCGEEP